MAAGLLLAACASPALPPANPSATAPATAAAKSSETPLPTSSPAAALSTASFSDFGRTFSFTYDPALAQSVEAENVPAVPPSPEVMFSDAHPALVQFRFTGYDGGRAFILPYPFQTPQLMAFPTQDFAGFGADQPTGFPQQLENLRKLLEEKPDLVQVCAQAAPGGEPELPFLPWLNSAQVFCAQPEYIEFAGGRGIRYLTATAQGPASIIDPILFYTFQGLSDDGEIYVSAVLPVLSGVFPTEIHPAVDGQLPQNYTDEQLATLNTQPAENFQPELGQLDALIRSLKVEMQP